MRITTSPLHGRLAQDERGFTLIIVMALLLVSSLLVAGAFSAADGDVNLTQKNTAGARAYYAAQAGIQVFEYNLNKNNEYWTECPKTAEPVGIPGEKNATYSYQILPATGHTKCEAKVQASIIETKSSANGTFRIQSTGEVEGVQRAIVATFEHPGFLNYVFLSNYEVEDPSTFSPQPKNCEHYYAERKAKKFLTECPAIPFIATDEIKGPFHTNDAVSVCSYTGGEPSFGRSSVDPVEIDGGTLYKWEKSALCGGSYNIKGKYITTGATLNPPATDNELLETAEYKFAGRTIIKLKGESMEVSVEKGKAETKPFPANGVVYVENAKSPTCTETYSPFSFDKDYETDAGCGDVYVSGEYTKSLTIASAKDVIINGPTYTTGGSKGGQPTGEATLGLIAQDFVRVYNPVVATGKGRNSSTLGSEGECEGNNQAKGETALTTELGAATKNLVIDAAILSTQNSFIVDNFLCGNSLGELIVWGAIAQFWRGRVTGGVFVGGGYPEKNYNYDERLKYRQPPNFLSPSSTGGWKANRETAPSG
jgi:Tfp pilus assembly protein PilX